MGATVHCEGFLPWHYSMRDLSEESNGCSWSVYYGDRPFSYGQYENGFLSRALADPYSGYEKDFVKRTMLEHEAIFKNQVYELHRLYRIQRNLMDEIKRKDLNKNLNPSETLFLSGVVESTPEHASKRQLPGFLVANSVCARPSILGSSSQFCNVPTHNGDNSKDVVVSDVRPVKVRRKMIDLHLPADEYIDPDEIGETQDNANCPERGNASKRVDSAGSCLELKHSNGLTDLNEPVPCQETGPVTSAIDIYSLCGRNNSHLQDQSLEGTRGQNGWKALETGRDKSSLKDKPHLPSQSVQVLPSNAFPPPGYPFSDHSKVKFAGERTFCDLETRSRNLGISYDSHVESSVASNALSSHSHHPESCRHRSHLPPSWNNPSCGSGHKSCSVQANLFLNSNTQARAPKQGFYGEGWHANGNFRANPSSESRCRDRSGIYQGSSSGSKEGIFTFSSISFNHLNNGSKGALSNGSFDEAVKHRGLESLQGPQKHEERLAVLPWLEAKPRCKTETTSGYLDLNVSINQLPDEIDTGNSLTYVSPHKSLKSVSCFNNADIGSNQMTDLRSDKKILGFPIFEKHSICRDERSLLSSPSMCIAGQFKEENKVGKRDLDINLPCNPTVLTSDQHGAEILVGEKEEDEKVAASRHQIDLNLCASEDEESRVPSDLSDKTKATAWIDLEAPAAPESEEDGEKLLVNTNEETSQLLNGEHEDSMDELIKTAAEAIVAISLSSHLCHIDEAASSSTEASAKDPLCWFADTVTSCGDELEKNINAFSICRESEEYREECSSEGFDYFEAMTLNLPETKEEDYMPKPLVPENLKFEETGPATAMPGRPRRGQARRGRPRRDFQRDILPGLVSLSRHEVTEDIQMFGGLMGAPGYSWSSGVTRRSSNRNGSNRGRRRLVNNNNRASPACPSLTHQTNNAIEVVGVEERSVTVWGKATRRPRRQRCPAGNPPTVVLI